LWRVGREAAQHVERIERSPISFITVKATSGPRGEGVDGFGPNLPALPGRMGRVKGEQKLVAEEERGVGSGNVSSSVQAARRSPGGGSSGETRSVPAGSAVLPAAVDERIIVVTGG